jgi:hypothetical protein
MAGGRDTWVPVKAAYTALGLPGRVAVAAGAACCVIVGLSLWSFGRSVVGRNVPVTSGTTDAKEMVATHDAAFARYLAQWNGRSLIVRPGSPHRSGISAETSPVGPPSPSLPPTEYHGPSIIAMVLDTVWFDDGKRLSVGDAPQDDLEVIKVVAPWEAVVRWKNGEFTVPLFQRDKLVIKPDETPAAPSPGDVKPQPTAAKTEPEKPESSKADPGSVVVSKPASSDVKPAGPETDAAPGPASATDPVSGPSPEANPTEISRVPAAGIGGGT